ncbi:MAG: MarR family winged helix-turn-helix transcriptional regulator [Solirubrobacteraceae bacterium]
MSEREHLRAVDDAEYRDLLEFRSELRRFLRWSEERAAETGLTPALHQLMLVIRGHPGDEGPTIADAAHTLDMRHHSAVELAQRAEAAGLIARRRDEVDHRRVHLKLTEAGSAQLEALTREHLPRIRALARALRRGFDEVC